MNGLWLHFNPFHSISQTFPEQQVYANRNKNSFLPIACVWWQKMTWLLCAPIISNLNPYLSYYIPAIFSFPVLLGDRPSIKPVPVISFCLPVWIWALAGVAILGIGKGGRPTGRKQWRYFSIIKKILAEESLLCSAFHAPMEVVMLAVVAVILWQWGKPAKEQSDPLIMAER